MTDETIAPASDRTTFTTPSGLAGWILGDGPEVLLLHGGPGMSDYMDMLLPELAGFRVASFQQRGLAPSSLEGPYDVPSAVTDVVAVLDHLGRQSPVVIGHSWGGHLLLHLLAAVPDRVRAALVVDPLGGVGDGGFAEFDAAMNARLPEHLRARAKELDDAMMAGRGTEEEAAESVRMYWPSYFNDPADTAPLPDLRISLAVMHDMWPSITAELPRLADRLRGCPTPTRFVHGENSPMPVSASADSAAVLGAPVDVVPAAGHFPWHEAPGCVRDSLGRLLDTVGDGAAD